MSAAVANLRMVGLARRNGQHRPCDCGQYCAGSAAGRDAGSSAAVCGSPGCGGGQARGEMYRNATDASDVVSQALYGTGVLSPKQPKVVSDSHRGWIYGLGRSGGPEDAGRRDLRAQGQCGARCGDERECLSRTRCDGARAVARTAVGGAAGTCAVPAKITRALARGAACGWADGLGAARRHQRRFHAGEHWRHAPSWRTGLSAPRIPGAA